MKKLLMLVAAAGLALGTIGCEKKAPAPTPTKETPAPGPSGGATTPAPDGGAAPATTDDKK
jgi:hypothetical protein